MNVGADVTDLLSLNARFSDAEREVARKVRALGERLLPQMPGYWERGETPQHLTRDIHALGIVGGTIAGYGCPGLSHLAVAVATFEFARIDGSLQTLFGGHSSLAMATIDLLGADEQKARWLPAMARMERIGAFALTEPEHGSDAIAIETRAHNDGTAWVLNGRKRWIGNGVRADNLIVFARDDAGDVGAFVLERPLDGFTATAIDGKGAYRAMTNADITLENVRIPLDNRLAKAKTFADATKALTLTRYGVAWSCLGHAVACFELARDHVLARRQFGAPLAAFQLVQDRLARMLAGIVTMHLLALRMCELAAADELTPAIAALGKMNNAKEARRIAADARDLLGGDGILLDRHVIRHQSDMEVIYTYEGTDFMQALMVGREITGIPAFAPAHTARPRRDAERDPVS
jgi:glutaryl-CoA dehydrogenase